MGSEKVFQFTWAVLHFAAACLHFSSAVYHCIKFTRGPA